MPKENGFSFTFEPSMAVKQTMEMISQDFLQLRLAAIKRKVMYDSANLLYEELLGRIPNTKPYQQYRDSLKIVQAGTGNELAFAVQAIPTQKEEIDGDTDIITFVPLRKQGKIDDTVNVLVKYQPWTSDTLPVNPDPKFANTVIKKTSKQGVQMVAKARRLQQKEWTEAFLKAGVRLPPRKDEVSVKGKGMPDFIFLALGLEFGSAGVPHVAAWRPALVSVKSMVSKMFSKDTAGFADAMLNWKNTEWKKWRNLSAETVSLSDLASFQAFQDKFQ